jgi:pimeloyl-ACP methyl ester carboxylesterase
MRARMAVIGIAAATLIAVPCAQAAVHFSPCLNDPALSCTKVAVPLERSSAVRGAISLWVERRGHRGGGGHARSAVIALAGGPGQAATPLAGAFAKAMAPALATRDLVVFDQRGTGRSHPLSCRALRASPALERVNVNTVGTLIAQCAKQLGSARGAYTSLESANDIEDLRKALGYEKLVLYGTSYGTKVALEYAEHYPQHVEAMVLDSVVPPNGPEAFDLSSLRALPPVLADLCSAGVCDHITSDPFGDIARLAASLRRRPLRGWVYDGYGHRHLSQLGESDLLGVLEAGDLNPALRALLPAAVQSALQREPDPLLRLNLLSEGLTPNVPVPAGMRAEVGEEEGDALFVATTCEERPFPWSRSAPVAGHRSEALAALNALPPAALAPFDRQTVWESSVVPLCLDWPVVSPPPAPGGSLPDVPTLVLSGAEDLRTPTANTEWVTARIPGAHLLVVPHTGHSVLGSDLSNCASDAVKAFFDGTPVQPCQPGPDYFTPTPVTPTRLRYVTPVRGLAARAGRTLTVVLDTLIDLERQVIGAVLQAEQQLPSGSSFGGLHGGYARLSSRAVRMDRFSFIPGVQLDGTVATVGAASRRITVRVVGWAAARGTVTLTRRRAEGRLGGRRFDVSINGAHISTAGAGAGTGAWRLALEASRSAFGRSR